MSTPIAFQFDGRQVAAREGQTIAAALAACGVVALGRRRDGTARGVWCGMGVCQECLVTVDGRPSRRACMEPALDGIVVTAQGYAAAIPSARAPMPIIPPRIDQPQVLVVGAGPAGLAAARGAALCGAKVTIVDERASPGGQYFKQRAGSADDALPLDQQMREGRDLIAALRELGVMIVQRAAVWGAFGPRELAAIVDGAPRVFSPERLVLATGAYERGVPLPGWTLPGYMTTGAAQTWLRAHRVPPGKRVLVAGNGPLNFQLAAELVDAGVEVVAVVEAAPRPDARYVLRAIGGSPRRMAQGLRYLARLRRAKVPVLYGSAVVAAYGSERVEACTVARVDGSGDSTRFAVDTVCAGYGFLPSNQIARELGCRHRVEGRLDAITDGEGLTTQPGVYAIGDAATFLGANAARLQGFITGCAVARSLDLATPRPMQGELVLSRRGLAREISFQRTLWRMFEAPPLLDRLAGRDTIICRCEHVTRGSIEDALRRGAISLGAIKRRTRAGMGRCQGRYCECIIAAMLPDARRDELSYLSPRAPITPIPAKDLA